MFILFVFPHPTWICRRFSDRTLGFPALQGRGNNRFQRLHPRRVCLQPRSDCRNGFFTFRHFQVSLTGHLLSRCRLETRELLSHVSVTGAKLLPNVTKSHKQLNPYQRDRIHWRKQPRPGKPTNAKPQGAHFSSPAVPHPHEFTAEPTLQISLCPGIFAAACRHRASSSLSLIPSTAQVETACCPQTTWYLQVLLLGCSYTDPWLHAPCSLPGFPSHRSLTPGKRCQRGESPFPQQSRVLWATLSSQRSPHKPATSQNGGKAEV